MLYVNETLVNTSNTNPDYEHADLIKDYKKVLKEAREYYGSSFVIETKQRPRKDRKTGALRHPGPRGLELKSNVIIRKDDGDVSTIELMYSPVILQKNKEGMIVRDGPNLLIKKAAHTVEIDRNPDLAYYIFKSGKVGRTPAEGKKFHVYDPKHINQEAAARRRLEGQVLNLIYSSLPEEKIRTLAKSFGIIEVGIKPLDTVREELYDRLQRNETQKRTVPESKARGYAEFIDSAEVKYHDQIAALCRDAEESHKLVFDNKERRWLVDYQDGATPYVLKDLAGDEVGDPMGALVSFLLAEPNKLRKVENVMGIGKIQEDEDTSLPGETPRVTLEMVLTEHRVPTLKKWLKDIDPDAYAKLTPKSKGQYIKELLQVAIAREMASQSVGG